MLDGHVGHQVGFSPGTNTCKHSFTGAFSLRVNPPFNIIQAL